MAEIISCSWKYVKVIINTFFFFFRRGKFCNKGERWCGAITFDRFMDSLGWCWVIRWLYVRRIYSVVGMVRGLTGAFWIFKDLTNPFFECFVSKTNFFIMRHLINHYSNSQDIQIQTPRDMDQSTFILLCPCPVSSQVKSSQVKSSRTPNRWLYRPVVLTQYNPELWKEFPGRFVLFTKNLCILMVFGFYFSSTIIPLRSKKN